MPKEDKERDWQKKLKQPPNIKVLLEHIVGALIIFLIGFFIFQRFCIILIFNDIHIFDFF